ncbi:metallophosphoesterase [Fructilactobacillus fructivorans]|nr:metallophosphoesterase [Fructilactobacillus fructivorans]
MGEIIMKFIHAADLHLDSPFLGIKEDATTPSELWKILHKAPFDSFRKIVDDAIDENVDFVLLVGDLFDGSHQSVKAISFLIEQLNRLDEHQIPILLSFGNHDYQSEGGKDFAFPKNVYVFPKEVTTHTLTLKDGKTVAVTGFSYATRNIVNDMISEFPERSDADYQIGMVHGAIKSGTDSQYAPFTINEMENLGYDYWALGHIHKRQQLDDHPLIEYPGNIQGRHKNEAGEKGYLLVTDGSDGNLQVHFEPTCPMVWSTLTMKLDGNETEEGIVNRIIDNTESQNFSKLHLLDVKLNFVDDGTISSEDLLDRIKEKLQYDFESLHAWVYEIDVVENAEMKFNDLDQEFWDETKHEVYNDENIKSLAKKLFKHSYIRDNFSSDDAIIKLLDESMNLITNKTKGNVEDED